MFTPPLNTSSHSWQLFSYTSEVLIAGASFSAAPDTESPIPSTANLRPTPYPPTDRSYLHVIDRLRILRTWLVHPGGATAVAAYSLPTAAPRVPVAPLNAADRAGVIGPESHHARSPGGGRGDNEQTSVNTAGDSTVGEGQWVAARSEGRGEERLQSRPTDISTNGDEKEEVLNVQSLAIGALTATAVTGHLRCSAGPGILVAAGVALSGVSFLPASEDGNSLLWENSRVLAEMGGDGSQGGEAVPRVLGMQGIVSGSGFQQALALLWAERPSFQVLDVGRAGSPALVQEVPLGRRHR